MRLEMKILILLFGAVCPVFAQSPTETLVFGAAANASGSENVFEIEQPSDGGNPLGSPIVDFENTTSASSSVSDTPFVQDKSVATDSRPESPGIRQSAAQNPPPFSESASQEKNQIQNTLYEGGNRIYDIQSYPLGDIKYITTPNIDPTLTTYPEY